MFLVSFVRICLLLLNLEKYKDTSYKSGCIYYDVPKIECPYPEKILAKYLHNYILLNYSINLDINRNTAC